MLRKALPLFKTRRNIAFDPEIEVPPSEFFLSVQVLPGYFGHRREEQACDTFI